MSKKPVRLKADKGLAAKLARPGGITPAEAIARANKCLDEAKDFLEAGLDDVIAQLPAGEIGEAQVPTAYDQVAEVLSISGTLRLAEMTTAARSMCDLLDAGGYAPRDGFINAGDPKVRELVRIHIDAIRLLNRRGVKEDRASCQALIDGLHKAVRRAS